MWPANWSVSRRTMHGWLALYEGDGLEGLEDRSHRPVHCPHQMPAAIEVLVLEMRPRSRLLGSSAHRPRAG